MTADQQTAEHIRSLTQNIGRGERPSAAELDESRQYLRQSLVRVLNERNEARAERDRYRGQVDRLIAFMIETQPHGVNKLLAQLRAEGPTHDGWAA